jgi:hypothetical protein
MRSVGLKFAVGDRIARLRSWAEGDEAARGGDLALATSEELIGFADDEVETGLLLDSVEILEANETRSPFSLVASGLEKLQNETFCQEYDKCA